MRRLLRCAFNLSAVVSAVLFIAVCVMWVRSYWRCDVIFHRSPHREFFLRSGRGGIEADINPGHSPPEGWKSYPDPEYPWLAYMGPKSARWDRPYTHLGFDWYRGEVVVLNALGKQERVVYATESTTPYWFVAAVLSLPPMLLLLIHYRAGVRKRRLKANVCPACGYDLRATPSRCPECGHVPAGKAAR